MLEFLLVKKNVMGLSFFEQLTFLTLKIPFVLGKILPLILFLTGFFFLTHLKRSQEWVVCQSAGASPWFLMRGPLLAVCLVALADLFYWHPWSNELMEKALTMQKNMRSADVIPPQSQWRAFYDQKNKVLIHTPVSSSARHPIKIMVFKDSGQLSKLVSAADYVEKDTFLCLHETWVLGPDFPPAFYKTLTLKRPAGFFKPTVAKHPFMMSFREAQKKSGNKALDKTVSLRWIYLFSHALWLVTLFPFAVACSAGYTRGR